MLGFQMAFDVTGDPEFPEQAAFEVARELGVPVTTHAGVWGATNDDGIRLMHEHGFMTPETIYVHAATLTEDSYHRIAATGGSVSVVDRERAERRAGLPADLAAAQARHPGLAVDGHERVVERRPVLAPCAPRSAPTARASTSRRTRKDETVTNHHLRAEQVVDWATRGGAKALGLDGVVGSLEPGKKADVVLIKNDASPVMFPILHPYGHVAFQAQRGDVHTVLVNGRVVKHDAPARRHRPRGARGARSRRPSSSCGRELGEDAWVGGHAPRDPARRELLDNPYQYTEYRSSSTHASHGL